MTTGATDTFQESCDEIIADALTNLGVIGPGSTASGKVRAHAFRALNRLVKEIDADGDFLWRTVRRDIAITANTASYGPSVLGTDVMAIEDPANFRLSATSNRSPVYAMSNEEFRRLADRTSQGTPLQYLVERTLAGLTITLWPVPQAAGTLEIMAALRGKDFVLGSDSPDFDRKWTRCLIKGLSGELAPAYGQDGSSFTTEFAGIKQELVNDDNNRTPLTLVPWGGF